MNFFKITLVSVFWFIATDVCAQGQIDVNDFQGYLQNKLDSLYQPEADFGGATVGISFGNITTIGLAVGYADIENSVKMNTDTRMLGGSTGKLYVSTAIMQLVEKHQLDLDEKVIKYLGKLNWFERIQNHQSITIRNLLQHTSGISRYVFQEEFLGDVQKDPDKHWEPQELLSYVFDLDPLFEAGSSFAYSDTNYILLAVIIEKVSGISMYKFIQDQILDKKGLEQVSPQIKRDIDNLAVGYNAPNDALFPGKVVEKGVYKYNVQFEWAGGGFVNNSKALAKTGKLIYEGNLFDASLLPEYFKGVAAKGLGGEWGLGVHIQNTPWGKAYGHSGFFPGYITNMLYFPEHKFSIAYQVNTSDRTNMSLYRKLNRLIPNIIGYMNQYKE